MPSSFSASAGKSQGRKQSLLAADGGGAGGWGGDAFPGQAPSTEDNLHLPTPNDWNPAHDYRFVYANGQLHISEDHSHDELASHSGIGPDYTGPMAMGHVHVDMGKATWEVQSNVSAQAIARVLKDYCKQVDWAWGGLTDGEGEPLGTGSEFAPVKSYYLYDGKDQLEFRRKRSATESIYGAVHVEGNVATVVAAAWPAEEGGEENPPLNGPWCPNCGSPEHYRSGFALMCKDCGQGAHADNWIWKSVPPKHPDPWMDNEPGTLKMPQHWASDYEHLWHHPEVVHQARGWLSDLGWGDMEPEDFYDEAFLPNHKIPGIMNRHYEGGMNQFVQDSYLDERTPLDHVTPQNFQHPDPWMDSEPGATTFPEHWSSALKEWAEDHNLTLRFAGNDNVMKKIEDLEENNNYTPEWRNDDDHFMFSDEPDQRQPGGVFKCPNCARIFPDWGLYLLHRRQEEEPHEDETQDDSGFPELNPDATFPPHESLPLKDTQASVNGPRFFNERANAPRAQARLAGIREAAGGSGTAEYGTGTQKQPEPRDMIQAPVPFIYDVQNDHIDTGSPGMRHSDLMIPGKFTPGGIVEGTYEPGGNILIRSMTNMPYTVRHMLELWYYQHPHMEIRSVNLMDDEGKKTKLAAGQPADIGGYIKGLVAADPTAWRAYKALEAAGGKVLVVGGAVRDTLMGKDPKDIDLMVTGLPAEDVRHALSQLPGRMNLTGKDFGVFRYAEKKDLADEVEISLPRRERDLKVGPNGRPLPGEADHTMTPEEDLFRRDFTANAMAVDLSNGQLIDPFDGSSDVQNGELRTLNTKSLADDPLRTMRALVALSKHGLYPTRDTKEQMRENADRLQYIAPERIQAELDKLFAGTQPGEAVRLAQDTGVLKYVLPEVSRAFGWNQNNPHHELELGDHLVNVLDRARERKPGDGDFALAALLHDIGKPDSHWTECRNCGAQHSGHVQPCPDCGSDDTSGHFYRLQQADGGTLGGNHDDVGAELADARLRALKYPAARINRVRGLIQNHMFPAFTTEKGARKFLNTVGEHADDLLHLRWADQGGKSEYPTDPSMSVNQQADLLEKVRNAGAPTDKSMLAINGTDLIAAGVTPGPAMGQLIQRLTEAVIENPELNTRDGLLGLVRAWS
jgi:tRNA nucleotidyltransferase (CCA-adding enzyme)